MKKKSFVTIFVLLLLGVFVFFIYKEKFEPKVTLNKLNINIVSVETLTQEDKNLLAELQKQYPDAVPYHNENGNLRYIDKETGGVYAVPAENVTSTLTNF